jgi:CDP-diacylglycerol--serine O-phosphatidyltransferase
MAVFAAMIFDTLDGRIARLTRTESAFGKEYDSLADMVAFGVAPAIVAYQWGVVRIMEYGHHWGRFGWLACFFYAVAAALRLARFNARSASADKRFFEGLPSPSAAAIVAAFVWFFSDWHEPRLVGLIAAFAVTATAGALMVSSWLPGQAARPVRHPLRLRCWCRSPSRADRSRPAGGAVLSSAAPTRCRPRCVAGRRACSACGRAPARPHLNRSPAPRQCRCDRH